MTANAGQTEALLSEILTTVQGLASSSALSRSMLEAFAIQEAALLPGCVVESGEVISGQEASELTTSDSTTINAQTSDVEIIEGLYVTITGLSSGGTVSATLSLGELVFPVTLTGSSPYVFLAPLKLPVAPTKRTLTVTSVSGTYTAVSAIMWGHVAPGRTRTVH